MKQVSLGLNLSSKRTRKREFLEEMNHVVPWAAFVELIRRITRLVSWVVGPSRWRPCFAFTSCSSGSA